MSRRWWTSATSMPEPDNWLRSSHSLPLQVEKCTIAVRVALWLNSMERVHSVFATC
jgi:hypothetical protein